MRKGEKMSEEQKQRLSHLGKVWSEESKRKASETHTGMHHSEETKKKMSDFWAQNLETKERRDALVRELWQNPEFRDRTLRAMVVGRKAGLTFPEKILQALLYVLKDVGGECWRYAGDGSYPVGGKKPDFINPEAKRIIEVYGDYWHRGDDPQERIDYFAELGYKTLVVWERELLPIKKSSDSFNIAVSDTVHRVWMFLS